MEGGHPSALLQITAFMIVIVGSLGATMVATLPSDMPFAIKALKKMFLPGKYDFHGLMEKILELANLARREGLLALETYANSGQGDPFLVKCLTLAIDGSSAEAIRESVEVDMHIQEEDDKAGMKFWETWGALAPTVGVLGAVLGLMHVMSVLSQPELIGPGIAVAFVATVYGVGYANVRVHADVVQAQASHRARPAAEEHGARGGRRHPVRHRPRCPAQQVEGLPRQPRRRRR